MSSTFLIAGATGNTGRSVVKTLSGLLKNNTDFPAHSIIALTRSANGAAAKALAQLPFVQVIEYDWVNITAEWLREHKVIRAFIASPTEPSQFIEESGFQLAALHAGVEYVVRISTTAANVRPDCRAFYPRSHWALEALLSSPEFEKLHWTSLQPNAFSQLWLYPAAELIKGFRKTGYQDTLRLMASEDAPVGIVDSDDVGAFAAHLLAAVDTTSHNRAKYVLNGPVDITGRQVVAMVEDYIGTTVKDVRFQDLSLVDHMASQTQHSKNTILTIKFAVESVWEGKCTASTTSDEVLQLAAPKRTPAEVLKALLDL